MRAQQARDFVERVFDQILVDFRDKPFPDSLIIVSAQHAKRPGRGDDDEARALLCCSGQEVGGGGEEIIFPCLMRITFGNSVAPRIDDGMAKARRIVEQFAIGRVLELAVFDHVKLRINRIPMIFQQKYVRAVGNQNQHVMG